VTDDALPKQARQAIDTWLEDSEPLSRANFDRINSALLRTVGEPASHPEYGTNKHLRETTARRAGQFAHDTGVALVDLDSEVDYVDLHGYAVDDGYVPVLVCMAGPIEQVAERMHEMYHLIDDTSPCECRAATDGGIDLRQRVERYLESHPDAGVPAVAGALGEDPAAVAKILDENPPGSGQNSSKDTGDRGTRSCARGETDPDEDLDEVETESGVHCQTIQAYDCWIPWQYLEGRKQPHAIYADTDNAMSWSDPANWRDFESVAMVCDDPRLEGLGIVLQHEDDPYADWADLFYMADYDDVRDPETGTVHPVVAEHVERAGTYADVSTSGTGVHILGIGQLPEDVKTIQAALPDHDAFPDAEIEVYDGKRFVAMTGDHVIGTPTEARESQAFLEDLVEEFVQEEQRRTPRPDSEKWDPEYDDDDLDDIDETDDLQAIVDAIRHVCPRSIRLKSNLTEERDDGTLSFDPSWEHSESGTRLGYDTDVGWIYRRGDVGLDALQVVALEERLISSPYEYPEGETWWDAVDALRDRGAHIPDLETERLDEDDEFHPLLELAVEREAEIDPAPVSALALKQLDALAPEERRRAARTRGLDWPTTDDARERLFENLKTIVANEDHRVLDAPTSLGKTFTVATTRWAVHEDATGERPVVHLLETRDARDEAIEAAAQHGGSYHVLRSRHEACPVAAGDHDPRECAECDDEDRQPITVDGEPASQVIDRLCDGKGIPFSVAHQYVAEHNDQGVSLPCGGDNCLAITQWETYREGPEDLDYWPLVIGTHNFAYAPGLRLENNIAVDEQPDYRAELSTERIRRAITAYLQAIDAPVTTWEQFVTLARHDDYQDDAAAERDAVDAMLRTQPGREWYLEDDDAHVLAPALARAIFRAEDRGNGRRVGKTPHEPPRLDANAHDEDSWNREWVSVVLDTDNEVRQVRVAPDFSAARSLVGLDAHPSEPVWQVDTVPWIQSREVLDATERRLWRRYERGLRVVQVGDATRPLSGEKATEWFDQDRDRIATLLTHLREEYGADWRTAITTAQVEDDLEGVMHEAGVTSPELMHYGEEKSRNDFAGETVGLVNGCMDPGDGFVLDLLAELDLDAEVETAEVEQDGETVEKRAKGRGFDGADAEAASAVLASVRENHVAQAAGRYARSPDDPTATATVFVRTDAAPDGFVDVQVPGVEWAFTELQRKIVRELRETPGAATTREISEAVNCSKEHVRQTLERLRDPQTRIEAVQAIREAGPDGATLYADDGLPNEGVVDVGESPTDTYETTSRWSLAIRAPDRRDHGDHQGGDPATSSVWDWQSAADGGGPPD